MKPLRFSLRGITNPAATLEERAEMVRDIVIALQTQGELRGAYRRQSTLIRCRAKEPCVKYARYRHRYGRGHYCSAWWADCEHHAPDWKAAGSIYEVPVLPDKLARNAATRRAVSLVKECMCITRASGGRIGHIADAVSTGDWRGVGLRTRKGEAPRERELGELWRHLAALAQVREQTRRQRCSGR